MPAKYPNIYGTHWGRWELSPVYYSIGQVRLIGNDWAAYWLGSRFSVEGATEYSSGLVQAVQEVLVQYPEWANLEIAFDGPPRQLWEVAHFDIPLIRDIVWLHGTSESAWGRIRHEGLLPRECTKVSAAYGAQFHCGEGDPRRTYLTTQRNMARFAARDAGRTTRSRPVILEVRDLNPCCMRPDEDSQQPTAELSLWTIGSIGYTAPIPPENLRLAFILGEDNNWHEVSGE